MKYLPRLHFWTGLLGVTVFLATGQYMLHVYNHLDGMADGPRMLFRSAHIYLLFTAILNLVLGIYIQPAIGRLRAILHYVISVIVLLSPWIMLAGFFFEPQGGDLARPIIRVGLYALFGVAVMLIMQNLWQRK